MAGRNKRSLDLFRQEAEQDEENNELERQNAENQYELDKADKKRKLEEAAKEQRIVEGALKLVEEVVQDAQMHVALAASGVREVQSIEVVEPPHMVEMKRLFDPVEPPPIRVAPAAPAGGAARGSAPSSGGGPAASAPARRTFFERMQVGFAGPDTPPQDVSIQFMVAEAVSDVICSFPWFL